MKTITGKLKAVSKTKGLLIEDIWYNIDKSIKEDFTVEELLKFKDKEIDLEIADKGNFYVSIFESKTVKNVENEFKNASEVQNYTKTKIFSCKSKDDLEKLESNINEFAKKYKPFASVPLSHNDELIVFVYYKTVE